ncbi:hypothetical protein SEA_KUDEFRE_32 [Gordonia phage Kudefre]|uniref:Glycine-rich domain-containing protein n=1 Tax=Gordonia phage Kudefre TaxID=2885975 RepID=A0AAE9C2X4_9CAUD|nr:minor tail protein [Gordonia phage Kudefre]UDL15266.1 hypothetical protein SEA_KUDEFRE_32 [Gordonia phage Kudefre]
MKTWNGSAFTDPAFRWWNGSAYVEPAAIYEWDGATFVRRFPAYQESIHQFTSTGSSSLPIPSWARYADVAVIGGGGGGGGRGSFTTNIGKGGNASVWNASTFDLLGNTATSVLVTVGSGGAAGPNGSPYNGSAGGTSSVALNNNPTNLFSSAGGAGGQGQTGAPVTPGGSSAGITTPFGITLPGGTGGAGGTGSIAPTDGEAPGAGGGGAGGGAVNPSRAGGVGGVGRVYVRFRTG